MKKTVAAKAEASKRTNAKGDDVDGKLKEKQDDNKIATVKKEKEQSSAKAGKENKVEQTKNKKNLKNLYQEKPVDFDDGSLIVEKLVWKNESGTWPVLWSRCLFVSIYIVIHNRRLGTSLFAQG